MRSIFTFLVLCASGIRAKDLVISKLIILWKGKLLDEFLFRIRSWTMSTSLLTGLLLLWRQNWRSTFSTLQILKIFCKEQSPFCKSWVPMCFSKSKNCWLYAIIVTLLVFLERTGRKPTLSGKMAMKALSTTNWGTSNFCLKSQMAN